ncbi:hypothetical protein CTI12_AA206710 [Artemisia annua]|uniref:Uncharacterized protein n=2 Tax=Artemisia annua TaxID=35608 RepID=A0A2U1NY54_ARTAN|nr:hypothetical protein CTI12_AA206710 [Artemisia annua]
MDQKTPDHATQNHETPNRKKPRKPTIAIRVLKAPLRAMYKIRDLYISSMYTCASGMGGPSTNNPYTSGLPKSYSTTSSRPDDDFAELMRIASTRSLGNKLDPEFLRRQQSVGAPVVPRSQSVAIGRIDENSACDDFGDDFRLKPELIPRSRSHAVTRMNVHS